MYAELEEETNLSRDMVVSVRPMRVGCLKKLPNGKLINNVCIDFLMELKDTEPDKVGCAFAALKSKEHVRMDLVRSGNLLSYVETNIDRFNTRTLFTLEHLLRII